MGFKDPTVHSNEDRYYRRFGFEEHEIIDVTMPNPKMKVRQCGVLVLLLSVYIIVFPLNEYIRNLNAHMMSQEFYKERARHQQHLYTALHVQIFEDEEDDEDEEEAVAALESGARANDESDKRSVLENSGERAAEGAGRVVSDVSGSDQKAEVEKEVQLLASKYR
jgi:hypothetical protein